MTTHGSVLAVITALLISPVAASAASLTDRLGVRFSAAVQRLDAERAALEAELARLPTLAGPPTERIGFQSKLHRSPTGSSTVQIDFGRPRTIDTVVLVPARIFVGIGPSSGYGFPVRFRIQIAEDAAFERSVTVADETRSPFANPGADPHIVRVKGIAGQYLRVTATGWCQRGDVWFWALGEILALEGNRNVAAGARVTSDDSLEAVPGWSRDNLVDGQSLLGPPVDSQPSPGMGYLATRTDDENEQKWVQVDLRATYPLEEIRLVPGRPTDFADIVGLGFPRRFRVEASDEPTFAHPTVIRDETANDFENPGSNPVTLPADGVSGRYVRFTATRLWKRLNLGSFALAELQVYSGGRNVAYGGTVTYRDRFDNPKYPGWQPQYLVDGFDSMNRLVELPAWFTAIERRRWLERRQTVIEIERRIALERAATRTLVLSILLSSAIVGALVVIALRQRRARRRETEKLRRQIAGDLHDNIGSQLSSIALISQMAREDAEHAAGQELAEIERIARESIEGMRDIVWLIDGAGSSVAELIAKMEEVARRSLAGMEYTFATEGEIGKDPLPLDARRHLLLAFKESLTNVVRHAEAGRVEICVRRAGDRLSFTVRDNGRGFDPAATGRGHGLLSLHRRAEALKGEVNIQSAPGSGAVIEFSGRCRRATA